jgi:hypothetical protein
MSSQTTNLHLVKPAYSEAADVAVINSNMDTIDTYTSTNRSSLAKAQSGLAYIVGNTNTTGGTLSSGTYVYVKGHSSIAEGLRVTTASISNNGSITTNNTSAVSGGGINSLNRKFSGFKFENIGNISSSSSQTFTITNGARMVLFPCGINADIQGVIMVSCNAAGTDSFITKLGATSLTVTKSGTNITIQNTTYQDVQIFGIVFAGSIS